MSARLIGKLPVFAPDGTDRTAVVAPRRRMRHKSAGRVKVFEGSGSAAASRGPVTAHVVRKPEPHHHPVTARI